MIIELLQRVCKTLDGNNVPYMISGSIALNIYTIPRMTRDIDIVVELTEKRVEEFTALFPDSYFNKQTIKDEIKRQGMFNIIDHKTGFKIDFIIRKETEYFRQAFDNRQRINELETDLWVIRLDDLVIAKLIWIQDYQSEKQIMDIENLLMNSEINMDYIKKWCNKMKLQTYNLFDYE